jgi:glucose-6-phosphate isomerase
MANFFAQTEALMNGKTEQQVLAEFEGSSLSRKRIEQLTPFKVFAGNKPTTTFLIDALSPATLGALIAMYEHKIFVQGVVWNIYSYDQWGVELGKQLAKQVLSDFSDLNSAIHDSSTKQLMYSYKKG